MANEQQIENLVELLDGYVETVRHHSLDQAKTLLSGNLIPREHGYGEECKGWKKRVF